MLSASMVIVLRIAHVVLGVLWVGAIVFMAAFIIPTVRAVPTGGAMMQHIMDVRRLPAWLAVSAIVTVLSGVTLYWNASMGFTPAWLGSGPGRTFGAGGALAIIALIIGLTVNNPGGRRLSALGATIRASGKPPTPDQVAELDRIQKRMMLSTRVIAVLLVLATTAMAAARYVG